MQNGALKGFEPPKGALKKITTNLYDFLICIFHAIHSALFYNNFNT